MNHTDSLSASENTLMKVKVNTMKNDLRLWILSIIAISSLAACDLKEELTEAIEDTINGEAAELAEADLPNCSKVINCCANIEARGISDEISEACNEQFKPATQAVIDNYQTSKMRITESLEGDAQTEGLSTLTEETQEIFEPGCRCFLEETAGQLENGTIDLIPQDCEFDSTTGALDGDLMCSDATDALLEAASM